MKKLYGDTTMAKKKETKEMREDAPQKVSRKESIELWNKYHKTVKPCNKSEKKK